MQNKENGTKRPCYFCFKGKTNDKIIWFIPISTKVDKYKKINNKKLQMQKRLGKNQSIDTLVLDMFQIHIVLFLYKICFLSQKILLKANTSKIV